MTLIPDIYRVALKALQKASQVILDIYHSDFQAITKEDGSPVTQADLQSSRIISDILRETKMPMIGEEQDIAIYEERRTWKEYWCIDPLDGTRMFLKRNNEFAINIAHIKNNRPVFGIIGDPVNQQILLGGKDYGVFKTSFANINFPDKWTKLEALNYQNNPVRIICSRSYTHGSGFKYVQSLERQFGELHYIKKGASLKFFELAEGRADIYPRFAPTMEWDIAPGHAIIEALGGEIVDVKENKRLRYNKESLYNPHFIVKTKAFT